MKNSIDSLIVKINQKKYYQIYLLFVIFIAGILGDQIASALPFMQTMPKVYFQNQTNDIDLDYKICKMNDFIIDHIKSKKSWVYEYEIYCDKLLITLLTDSFYFGCFIGCFFMKLASKYGNIKILSVSLIINGLSFFFLLNKHIYFLYIAVILMGINNLLAFLLKCAIMTEISERTNRAFLVNMVMTTSNFIGALVFYFFQNNIHWKYYFYGNFILSFILAAILILTTVENPRFYYINNKREQFFKCVGYICKFNSLDAENILYEYTNEINSEIMFLDNNQTKINNEVEEKNINIQDLKKIEIMKLILFLVISPLYNLNVNLMMQESKRFAYVFNMYFYLYCLICFFVQFFFSYVINFKYIGRKGSLIMLHLIILASVIITFFINDDQDDFKVINYLIKRICFVVGQFSFSVLINESFSTVNRVKYTGILFFASKILCFMVPFINEYLLDYFYFITLGMMGFLTISTFFLKETLNQTLFDKND